VCLGLCVVLAVVLALDDRVDGFPALHFSGRATPPRMTCDHRLTAPSRVFRW